MSIKDKEYSFGVNRYNKPASVEGKPAIGMRLMTLMTMEPGDDPLHPDMGVGIKNFRYAVNQIGNLEKRILDQINTYLPFYQDVKVTGIITPDKVINVEITIGDTVYLYDSNSVSKPITLDEIKS